MNVAVAPLPVLLYDECVRRALLEDLGGAGDLTTDALVPSELRAEAALVARAAGRVAGLDAALHAFHLLDPQVQIETLCGDGQDAAAGTTLALVRGRARALLSGERVALNLLGRLCGIASATRDVVARLEGLKTRVACTRKTTPGLRVLEKHAVRLGGGSNHRFGLDDAVLIKDNHRRLAGGVGAAIRRARAALGHMVKLEAEVESFEELDEALAAGVDAVLLDNFTPPDLRRAVTRVAGRALTEASGGITPATVRAVAESGVDLLSLGWLTHSAPALDVAMDLPPRT
jgi:nicotinate-nucleotide pyrophosphorylase (carboxylating)